MVVLVSAKNNEDPIKNKRPKVLKMLNINFSKTDKGSLLIHMSLASCLWDIGKQYSPRCEAHLGLFCLLNENSSKNGIKIKNHA